MYGSVARVRVKAGMETQFARMCGEIGVGKAPGQIAAYAYQMDADSREFYLAILFESREAYRANASRPEQHENFMKFAAVLESEPDWHDGELVYAGKP